MTQMPETKIQDIGAKIKEIYHDTIESVKNDDRVKNTLIGVATGLGLGIIMELGLYSMTHSADILRFYYDISEQIFPSMSAAIESQKEVVVALAAYVNQLDQTKYLHELTMFRAAALAVPTIFGGILGALDDKLVKLGYNIRSIYSTSQKN